MSEEKAKKWRPSPKMDRKTAEKNRRIQMKNLYSNLNSLIPANHSREVTLLSDQLDVATNYIKALQEKLEKMKERKECLMKINRMNEGLMTKRTATNFQSPNIEIQDLGSSLVVLLICELDNKLIFYESIRILEEEGVEVVNASFFVMGGKVFHTMHSKVADSKLGFEAARISERLYKLVHGSSNNL